jgi:hypothetical protein
MTWNVWSTSPFTGDRKYIVRQFSNRGHAVAFLRGLIRRAWAANSEATFSLQKG